MPEVIPNLTSDDLNSWRGLSYPDLVFEVVSRFVSEDELPKSELKAILERGYDRFDPKIEGKVMEVG